ncbi:MAG: TonB-dependent receptor domain-containing protein [Candidatus Eisenbacteria bacterium]
MKRLRTRWSNAPMRLAVSLAALVLATLPPLPARAGAAPDTTVGKVVPITVTTRSDTLGHVVPVSGVEVSTARADRVPIARTLLDRKEVQRRDTGLDTPMHFADLPGVYAYSDAGNGVGYSYLAIRGFPQRRVSVLIDGVPLNDPQSNEVYWIDHPDILASTSQVQVQRGVGSAMYGAPSLGGSVNLETSPFSVAPALSASTGFGSYDTWRVMGEMASGELKGGWNVYGRYSRIESGGYRDQSDTELWSYFLGLRRVGTSQSIRFETFGGPEETHLAYLGVSPDYLAGQVTGDATRDRRYNPLTYPGERDHFFEPHYVLTHTWAMSRERTFTQTLYGFDGSGYYDEQRGMQALSDYRLSSWAVADSTLYTRDHYQQDATGALVTDSNGRYIVVNTDLVRRRWVGDRQIGWLPRLRLGTATDALTVGGELRWADGHHVGTVVSGDALPPGTTPDSRYYDYRPYTVEGGLYARAEWSPDAALSAVADLGWRHMSYAMRGDQFDGIRFDQHYDFLLPRLGLTWHTRPGLDLHASYAYSSREPAFRDLYDGETAGAVPLYGSGNAANNDWSDPLITPEHVNDWEAGARWASGPHAFTADLYRMELRDELVYAGQFDTDLGYPITGNAARSIHQGIELAGHTEWAIGGGNDHGPQLTLDGNASLGDHHFVEYHEVYGTASGDTVTADGKRIGFTPAVTAFVAPRVSVAGTTVGAEVQYVGRIYVDNTETEANSIAPRTTLDVTASQRLPLPGVSSAELSFRLVNALDLQYATTGYLDYDASGALVPFLTPAAPRHWFAQLTVRW